MLDDRGDPDADVAGRLPGNPLGEVGSRIVAEMLVGQVRNDPYSWLVLPVHLPDGRSTAIRDARLADPITARRRIANLTRQFYRRSPGRDRIAALVDMVANPRGTARHAVAGLLVRRKSLQEVYTRLSRWAAGRGG